MGGQILGGGVVVLVAVVLWLVYLLPSWQSRHQYEAAERNAVRLNRALRVLAETSETPEEVRVELNARSALAQQRLAKRAQAEREQAQLERAKQELALARAEARAEARQARRDAATARERARVEAAIARSAPGAVRARARRRVRMVATVVCVLALAATVPGVFVAFASGSSWMLWISVPVALAAGGVLHRMSTVGQRAAVREIPVVQERAPRAVQDVELIDENIGWTPRELPRPLTASAGSRASAVLDEVDARTALRRTRVDEALRARAEAQRPPSLAAARAARPAAADELVGGPALGDEVIEAHVRRLLERRAVGQ